MRHTRARFILVSIAVHALAALALVKLTSISPAYVPRVDVVLREMPGPVKGKPQVSKHVVKPKPAVEPVHEEPALRADQPMEEVAGSDSTEAPPATYEVEPAYPREALRNGFAGRIRVRFDINEKGRVENVDIVEGKHVEVFRQSILQAMMQWQYEPYRDASGTPHRLTGRTKILNFKLE